MHVVRWEGHLKRRHKKGVQRFFVFEMKIHIDPNSVYNELRIPRGTAYTIHILNIRAIWSSFPGKTKNTFKK
jgi:hypothetical protein